jgi:hypothetical protein
MVGEPRVQVEWWTKNSEEEEFTASQDAQPKNDDGTSWKSEVRNIPGLKKKISHWP